MSWRGRQSSLSGCTKRTEVTSWPACSYLLLAFLHLSRSLSGLLISSQAGSRRTHLKKICFPPFSCHPASMKKVKSESRTVMSDSAILWTVTGPAPLSIGFSRPEYWSRLIFPSPRDPPHPGIEPRSPALQADALPSEPPGKPLSS